jgi:hypothetical protein
VTKRNKERDDERGRRRQRLGRVNKGESER